MWDHRFVKEAANRREPPNTSTISMAIGFIETNARPSIGVSLFQPYILFAISHRFVWMFGFKKNCHILITFHNDYLARVTRVSQIFWPLNKPYSIIVNEKAMPFVAPLSNELVTSLFLFLVSFYSYISRYSCLLSPSSFTSP